MAMTTDFPRGLSGVPTKACLGPQITVTIPAIKNKNTMFFMEELSTDPKHLWCKCIANYYRKADIHLRK